MFMTIALTSCSKDIPNPAGPGPLVFSAVASHSTKSIITTTTYPLDEPFMVDAVYYPQGMGVPDSSRVFMADEIVTYDYDYEHWRAADDYFWPEKGIIHFYAGSPIIDEMEVSAEKGVTFDWEIPTVAESQTDLCFSEVIEDCSTHSTAVPIVFSHALSQICFKARPLKYYSSSERVNNLIQSNVFKVMLDSVKINGIVSKGQFNQTPKPGWTNDTSATTGYELFRSNDGLELHYDDYDSPILTQYALMLLIPQDLPEDATLEEWHRVVVRTSVTDANTGRIVSDITYAIPGSAKFQLAETCSRWNMDFKYTFRLAIGLEDSELIATVTDWTEPQELILGDE